MESIKLGRRRNQDLGCDGYRQIKQRMTNGTFHMNSTEEWQLSSAITNKLRTTTEARPALSPPRAEPSPPSIKTTTPEEITKVIRPDVKPVLPPGPRESVRMQSVEQWINKISPEAPLWVQHTLDHAIPVNSPHEFISELNRADNNSSSNDSSKDTYSSQLCSNPLPANCARNSPQHHNFVDPNFNKQSVGCAGNPFPVSSGLLGPRQPGAPTSTNFARMRTGHSSFMQAKQVQCIVNTRPPLNLAPPGRFFDERETGIIIKLFIDHFRAGTCPNVNDVRHRITNSILQLRRNPTSIRSKFKRLQSSGRWTDFPMPDY